MGDDVLRALERTFDRTGDEQDGRRWLAELERRGEAAQVLRLRVRLGDLDAERLALAAYAGHPGAQAAVGGPPPPADLEAWAEGLWRWGQSACVRAVLALAPLDGGPPVDVAGAWLEHASEGLRSRASELSHRAGQPGWAVELLNTIHCPPRTSWPRMRGTWQGCRHHVTALLELAAGEPAAARATAERAIATWAVAAATEADERHRRAQLGATMWESTWAGDVEVVSATLDRGWPIDQRFQPELDTPLHVAVLANQEAVVALLLERGAAVELEFLGRAPLARVRSVEVAKRLLARGAKLTPTAFVALVLAKPPLALVRLLLEAGADPDAIDPTTGRSARQARPALFKKLGLPSAPKKARREKKA